MERTSIANHRTPVAATLTSIAVAVVAAGATPAAADPAVSYRIAEDGALGLDLPTDRALLGGIDAALGKCTAGAAPTGSAVFWVELAKSGKATAAHVHGAGALDGCLAKALAKAAAVDHLAATAVVVGRIDLMAADSSKFLASPRVSTTPVMFDPHGTAWQVTATRVTYTANRAADLGQALDATSVALAACAAKRPKSTTATHALAWIDGHDAIVRSGATAYDACAGRALAAIKLPAAESAAWLELELTPPGEPLAPRTDDPKLSHARALRDALTTAVRSRRAVLETCLDGHPAIKLAKLEVELHAGKAGVHAIATGDQEVDACVRGKFTAIAIPNAQAADDLVETISLAPE